MPVQTTIQMRRDTAANWTSTNPTLASGEWGLETDTRLMKIGNGTSAWNSLAYQLGPLLDEVIATNPICNYFDGTGFVMLGGDQRESLTSPDSAALDITGDIDIRVKAKLDDWTPSALSPLVTKRVDNTQRSYMLNVNTDGTLQLWWSTDGSTFTFRNSTVATGFTDGATKWVRATLDVDNGAVGHTTTFYTSDDGITWTQLGIQITNSTITSIFSSTALLELGSFNNHGSKMVGVLYRVQIRNGIDGTIAFDADLASVPSDSFAFTESSSNAATVTLVTGRYSFGLPGTVISSLGTVSYSPNQDTYYPIRVLGKPITVKHFAFEVGTGPATSSNVFLGLYAADAQMQPTGNALYASSAITVPASTAGVGIYRIRVTPFTLKPGNYLIAFTHSVTIASMRTYNAINGFIPNTLGNAVADTYRATRAVAAFTNSPSKWSGRSTNSTGTRNPILLGWS